MSRAVVASLLLVASFLFLFLGALVAVNLATPTPVPCACPAGNGTAGPCLCPQGYESQPSPIGYAIVAVGAVCLVAGVVVGRRRPAA